MHDLNYQLKQLCENNRDGSYGTQAQRAKVLQLCAEQLHGMDCRKMTTHMLKPKHVDGLTKRWLSDGLSAGPIKNRMSALRWWAAKVNRQNVIAWSNEHYGIPDRKLVVEESKAKSVSESALEKVRDAHVRMSLELQQAFGLRREEAINWSNERFEFGLWLMLSMKARRAGPRPEGLTRNRLCDCSPYGRRLQRRPNSLRELVEREVRT